MSVIHPEITPPQEYPAMQAQDAVIRIVTESLRKGQLPSDCPEEAIRLWRRRRDLAAARRHAPLREEWATSFRRSTAMRSVLIAYAHGGTAAAPEGVHAVKRRLQASYWWPSMKESIAQALSHCDTCHRMKAANINMKAPLTSMPVSEPMERVQIDTHRSNGQFRRMQLCSDDDRFVQSMGRSQFRLPKSVRKR